jgi:transcription termination/antitermination protein NusG
MTTTTTTVDGRFTDWYTVKVQNNYERKVSERIELEMKRAGKDYNICMPAERTFSVKKGKKVFKDKMKYPGYIFVQTKYVGELMNIVRMTEGATNVVYADNKKKIPAVLPVTEVKVMLNAQEELDKPLSDEVFIKGESLKILDGPFADLIGKVDEIYPDKSKVKVLVSIFKKETPVELDFNSVAKV